jgi:TatD DNase family protein
VVASIPDEFLLVETDAPFLTPHPYRGERNEPALVRYVAEKIALIRQMNIETITEITTLNAERLFRW